jgi:hypothetical protein
VAVDHLPSVDGERLLIARHRLAQRLADLRVLVQRNADDQRRRRADPVVAIDKLAELRERAQIGAAASLLDRPMAPAHR